MTGAVGEAAGPARRDDAPGDVPSASGAGTEAAGTEAAGTEAAGTEASGDGADRAPVAGAGGVRPLVVLVGAPGAGKTTVGTLLAHRLGVTLRDTDADVEATTGMAVSDIFIELGEEAFRAAEREAVAAALTDHPGVLALGGGALLSERTRAALAGHAVVFLDVDLSEAAKRVGLARDRPLLIEAPRARLTVLLRERKPLYEEVATVVVETAGRTPQEVADEVLAALPLGGR